MVALRLNHFQQREEHWAIVDLIGKGGHVRTVPLPAWVKSELDVWLAAAAIDRGKVFRPVHRVGKVWGDGMTEKAVWHIVKEAAQSIGVTKLAPPRPAPDLRSALPSFGRRAGANPIPIGTPIGADDGTLSWLQTTDPISRE